MNDMTPDEAYTGVPFPGVYQPDPREERMALFQQLTAPDNLAEMLEDAEIGRIGQEVISEFEIDDESMSDWREKMQKGVDLAKLVKETKSYPFPNASNVKYPLVTSAALQFNARAYPAIVPAERVVKAQVFGSDADGMKAARADRVSAHMSYQLLNEVEEWEEETDKLLVQLPIVGTMVRKVWFDGARGRIRCRVIDPGEFIVNDRARNLSEAPRVSEKLMLYPSEIKEREASGVWRVCDYGMEDGADKDAPVEFIEQHRLIDLDGDGTPEPYIVVVHRKSAKVARIAADYTPQDVNLADDGRVLSIQRNSYFVAYHFLPSMDGGFHGTGLGLLLGDISAAINTNMNMLIDAGHMSSLGGGFIGSGFRVKGGNQMRRPGEWKMVGTEGAVLRDSIVPITFPEPNNVLFQMLGMLIEAGREVASVKDVLTGDTGNKNMTATTTIALIEQGMMVFTASYKRIFRSLKREFKLIGGLNALHASQEAYAQFHDEQVDVRKDYSTGGMDIAPVADPNSVTKMQEAAKANLLMQMALQGLADPAEAASRVFEAMDIADREALMPKPDPAAQAMQMMGVKAAEADLMAKFAELQLTMAKIEEARSKSVKNMADAADTESQTSLNQTMLQMKVMKDEIESTLARGLGGMAGATANGGPGGIVQQVAAPAPEGFAGAGVDPGMPFNPGSGQPVPGGGYGPAMGNGMG